MPETPDRGKRITIVMKGNNERPAPPPPPFTGKPPGIKVSKKK